MRRKATSHCDQPCQVARLGVQKKERNNWIFFLPQIMIQPSSLSFFSILSVWLQTQVISVHYYEDKNKSNRKCRTNNLQQFFCSSMQFRNAFRTETFTGWKVQLMFLYSLLITLKAEMHISKTCPVYSNWIFLSLFATRVALHSVLQVLFFFLH